MRSIFHFFVVMCCTVLLAVPSTAQEKSGNSEPAAAGTSEGSAKPASTPEIRTLSGEHVYRVADGLTPPRIIQSPEPKSPETGQEQRVGAVVLWLIINAQGLPEQIRIQKSLRPKLDQLAAEAVSHWKFAPATKDGVPVPVMINIQVNFKVH
jgi:protein TonB